MNTQPLIQYLSKAGQPLDSLTDVDDPVLMTIELLKGNVSMTDDVNDTGRHIIEEVFSRGNCGRFALMLATIHGGEIVKTTNGTHFALRKGKYVYDIFGRSERTDVVPADDGSKYWMVEMADAMDNYSFATRGPIV